MAESNAEPYSFSVVRFLTDGELDELEAQYWPKITTLSAKYLPHIDVSVGMPAKVEFLDLLRGLWMHDASDEKPFYDDVRDATAYGQGCLLRNDLDMKWVVIRDNFGESISLIGKPDPKVSEYREISFPPFSYLEKRRGVENVEVCSAVYRMLKAKMSGEPVDPDNPLDCW